MIYQSCAALPSEWDRRSWGRAPVGGMGAAPAQYLKVDGLALKYVGPGESDAQAASILADHPVPGDVPLYYFEVTVVSRGDQGYIGLGFCCDRVNLGRLPGWEPGSYGYHGDDGHAFRGSGSGAPYGPSFTTGDVVGALLDRGARRISYFKNGECLGVAFENVGEAQLYPCVGMRTQGEEVRANFGASPFAVDLAALQAQFRAAMLAGVAAVPVPAAPLLPYLVFDYLLHQRCWRTAEVVARDMLGGGGSAAGGGGGAGSRAADGGDDVVMADAAGGSEDATMADAAAAESGGGAAAAAAAAGPEGGGGAAAAGALSAADVRDALLRQQIFDAVCAGRVAEALASVSEHYGPAVLQESPRLAFKLRVQQFVELVRGACAPPAASNGAGGGSACFDAALAFGRAELGPCSKGREEEELLSDALSLLAYADPAASPCGHLLRPAARGALAEELNGALLKARGTSAQPLLECIYRQAAVALDELRRGGLPAAQVLDPAALCLGGGAGSSAAAAARRGPQVSRPRSHQRRGRQPCRGAAVLPARPTPRGLPLTWLRGYAYAQGYVSWGLRNPSSLKERALKAVAQSAIFTLGMTKLLPAVFNAPPEDRHGRLPVVIFSHGAASMRNTCSILCSELASRGFVVAALEHADGTACCVELADGTHRLLTGLGTGAALEAKCEYRVTEARTMAEALAAIDSGASVPGLELSGAPAAGGGGAAGGFVGLLDMRRLAIVGHSCGGATAAAAAAEHGEFSAAIALDPWWPLLPEKSAALNGWRTSTPLLVIGSQDWNQPETMFCGGARQQAVFAACLPRASGGGGGSGTAAAAGQPERARVPVVAAAAAGGGAGGGALHVVPAGSSHGSFTDLPFLISPWLSRALRKAAGAKPAPDPAVPPAQVQEALTWTMHAFLDAHLALPADSPASLAQHEAHGGGGDTQRAAGAGGGADAQGAQPGAQPAPAAVAAAAAAPTRARSRSPAGEAHESLVDHLAADENLIAADESAGHPAPGGAPPAHAPQHDPALERAASAELAAAAGQAHVPVAPGEAVERSSAAEGALRARGAAAAGPGGSGGVAAAAAFPHRGRGRSWARPGAMQTRRAARVAAWRAAAASDYSERDWQVGCLLAESGALLPAVPDLLDNALTAVHDLAALGCVSRAFARVVKERMWSALADKYADDEWRCGTSFSPQWWSDRGCVRRFLIRVSMSRPADWWAAWRTRFKVKPPEVQHGLFNELTQLDIDRVTAGTAKKHFRLSEGDLALLPCTEKKWGKNKTALSRRYPLAVVMLAARAKHGSVTGMQAAAAAAKAARGGSAERRKEALAAGLAKLGFSLTDALAGISVVDRHIRGVKGSITEPQEMLRTVQLMAWAAKHAEYLNVRESMLDSEVRTSDMYNHYNQAYLKSDYNLWALPEMKMDIMAGVLTLEEELACLHVACQAWAHMRGGSEQALQRRSVPSRGSLRDSIAAALAAQVSDKLRSYASPWTNSEFLMDYINDVYSGGSPHASATAEEATAVSSDDDGSDGEVDGPGQEEEDGEEEVEEEQQRQRQVSALRGSHSRQQRRRQQRRPAPGAMKYALVTGGNRGIGLEVCKQLAQRGKPLLLCSRDVAAGRAAAAEVAGAAAGASVEVLELDVASADSIAALAEAVRSRFDGQVDLLVNNAGVVERGVWERGAFERTLATNASAPVAIASALLPHLAPGALVIMVSSGLGQLSALSPDYAAKVGALAAADLPRLAEALPFDAGSGMGSAPPERGAMAPTYSVAKAALNRAVRPPPGRARGAADATSAQRAAGRGRDQPAAPPAPRAPQVQLLTADEAFATRRVSVVSTCPGWCRTDMGTAAADRSASEGAASVLWPWLHWDAALAGGFTRDGEALEW
ncbi:Ranbp10 [Scenedesmus sp. PABB004]|nr:Ranbp10 [Scenedesmus sp. PABB004]